MVALVVVNVLLAGFLISHRAPTLTEVAVAHVAGPVAMTVSPDDDHLYVAGPCCDVSVIDPATGAVTATIPTGHGASGLAISPDGTRLYAADPTSDTVSVVNTAAHAVAATVRTGPGPLSVAVAPDGRTAYVAEDSDPGAVAVIDTATAAVRRTIPVGGNPAALAVTPDGRAVYVTNDAANTVAVIDTATGAVTATTPVGEYPGAGQYPQAVTITPDGRYAYVASPQIGQVSVIDTSSATLVRRIPASGFMIVPNARAERLPLRRRPFGDRHERQHRDRDRPVRPAAQLRRGQPRRPSPVPGGLRSRHGHDRGHERPLRGPTGAAADSGTQRRAAFSILEQALKASTSTRSASSSAFIRPL